MYKILDSLTLCDDLINAGINPNLSRLITKNFVSKGELNNFATKNDINNLERDLIPSPIFRALFAAL